MLLWLPGNSQNHASASREGTHVRDLHTRRTRRGQQGRALSRGHGNRQFIVVAASQHVAPERRIGRQNASRRARQRNPIAFDPRLESRRIGDVADIGQQPVRDVSGGCRYSDEAWPEGGARLRQTIALLQRAALQLASSRQQAERGIADRAAHPEFVPCPRAAASQSLAARDLAEGGNRDRRRARRSGRVATAQR